MTVRMSEHDNILKTHQAKMGLLTLFMAIHPMHTY